MSDIAIGLIGAGSLVGGILGFVFGCRYGVTLERRLWVTNAKRVGVDVTDLVPTLADWT